MDEAIESALEMNEDEQRDRMSRMTDAVESYTVRDWADEQISGLSSSTPQ
jgi:glucosylglycerol-phosphate synthase